MRPDTTHKQPPPTGIIRPPHKPLRLTLIAAIALPLLASRPTPTRAQIVTGSDWTLAYSLPSQTYDAQLPGEYAISDLLVSQVQRLRHGNRADLATFTFTGNWVKSGGAAPLMRALHKALDRGARISFTVNSGVEITNTYLWGISLQSLSKRYRNPLHLTVAPPTAIMHHKTGIFDYGNDEKYTFIGSGNFTRAANAMQWNVGLLIRNPDLYAACRAELNEFQAGRFGADKNRTHDARTFRLADDWGQCQVRFGPFPTPRNAPTHPEQEILRLIESAQHEIYFAMHRFSRPPLRNALVAAADRGVKVVGVIPKSDTRRGPGAVSRAAARYFATPENYQTTNRVTLLPALARADALQWDAGEPDLVHLKYALIDPAGEQPVVIHGCANWTKIALADPKGNDEVILYLRHAGIARALLEQFQRMTGQIPPVEQTPPQKPLPNAA